MMRWVGLTGGIATGKSTVSKILVSRGLPVVDADQLAREAVASGSEALIEIARVFGPGALLKSGELDRKAIGAIVFSDRTKLSILEGIIHPKVRELCLAKRKALEAAGNSVAFYDVPLLFEKNMREQFDSVLLVASKPEFQRQRMAARDGLPADEIDRRLAAQIPIHEKISLSDYVIHNDGTIEDLERAVDHYISLINKGTA